MGVRRLADFPVYNISTPTLIKLDYLYWCGLGETQGCTGFEQGPGQLELLEASSIILGAFGNRPKVSRLVPRASFLLSATA